MPDLYTTADAMPDSYYGVTIGQLGELGDEGMVALTHDRRRALAALSAYARHNDYEAETGSVGLGKPLWWLLHGTCGCGTTCPHKPDVDGNFWHEDPDCDRYGLPPCIEDGDLAWRAEKCAADTPGAVPVLLIDVEWT